MDLKDSGSRTKFDTGAVRDCKDENGRCDLMPLDQVARVVASNGQADPVLTEIHAFHVTGDSQCLISAVQKFLGEDSPSGIFGGMLELSHHFRDGAKKYGEHNWENGIPISSYIDSAVRHYLKYKAGWKDERHDRAFVWNAVCAAWTVQHLPEMDDYSGLGVPQ